jgi:hypothetical protein
MRTAYFFLTACCLFSSSAWAIDCQSSPGARTTGWWSWREIEGRKCWFIKAGAMPPKSELHWPAMESPVLREAEPSSAKEPINEELDRPAAVPTSQTAIKHSRSTDPLPHLNILRTRPISGPEESRDNHIDLMSSAPLSRMQVFRGSRRKPANADPFNARFKGSDADQPFR